MFFSALPRTFFTNKVRARYVAMGPGMGNDLVIGLHCSIKRPHSTRRSEVLSQVMTMGF